MKKENQHNLEITYEIVTKTVQIKERKHKKECLQDFILNYSQNLKKKILLVRKHNWNTYIIIISVITLWTTEQMLFSRKNLRSTFSHTVLYNLTITCTPSTAKLQCLQRNHQEQRKQKINYYFKTDCL